MVYRFAVYGMPGPMGSKKFVGTTKSGRGLMVESSKKVKPWREAVKQQALQERGAAPRDNVPDRTASGLPPLDGPLAMSMVFTLPKPASAPKRKRTWPDKKPDVSKLARSTEDALTDAGLIRDDARIVGYLRLWKTYPNEDEEALDTPGAIIAVYRIVEQP